MFAGESNFFLATLIGRKKKQTEFVRPVRFGLSCAICSFRNAIRIILRSLNTVSRITVFLANDKLTSREMELLQFVAEGKANKQIAVEFAISIKTVEKHRQNVMKKLDLHDTAGMTRYAVASGIIELTCA